MNYREKHNFLIKSYNPHSDYIKLAGTGLEIFNIGFSSDSWQLLPGQGEYACAKHNLIFNEKFTYADSFLFQHYPDFLKHNDTDILENREFNYTVFKKSTGIKSDNAIFLFHGLNEKYWDKYLSWAEKLVELTGKTVILFPIAFHMNRVPADWSNPRLMNNVTRTRHEHSHSITNSTFANAAISARIQMIPQRFFWSGLQTYYDVLQLIEAIKTGNHPLISQNAHFDLFAYSIGSFLSEILLMANHNNYFSNSKLFIFCGGPTLDRMSPNSKFILDSDATIAIYSFYTERLESELKNDKRIAHYFNGEHPAGKYFRAMLSYKRNKELRENRFAEISDRIRALALKNDEVIPPNEVLNTLQGDLRDIPVKVDVMDFPYPYSHIIPFPAEKSIEAIVETKFNEIFEKAAQFLA